MKYTILDDELQVQKNNGMESIKAENLKMIKLGTEKYSFVMKSGQEIVFWDKKGITDNPEDDFRRFATEHNLSIEYVEKYAHAKPEEITSEIGKCYRECKAKYKEVIEIYIREMLGAGYSLKIEDDFEAYRAAMQVSIYKGDSLITVPASKNPRSLRRGKEKEEYVPSQVAVGELISYDAEKGVAKWFLYNDLDMLIKYKMQDIDAIKDAGL